LDPLGRWSRLVVQQGFRKSSTVSIVTHDFRLRLPSNGQHLKPQNVFLCISLLSEIDDSWHFLGYASTFFQLNSHKTRKFPWFFHGFHGFPVDFHDFRRGARWFAVATTVAEAVAAEAAGADAIVAQGVEAGGHRGAFRAEDAKVDLVGLVEPGLRWMGWGWGWGGDVVLWFLLDLWDS